MCNGSYVYGSFHANSTNKNSFRHPPSQILLKFGMKLQSAKVRGPAKFQLKIFKCF